MDIWNMCNEHRQVLKEYESKINDNNSKEVLSGIYKYIKSINNFYYIDDDIHPAYEYILSKVRMIEKSVSKNKIVDIKLNFEKILKADDFINYLVHESLNYLMNSHKLKMLNQNIEDINLTNYCYHAASYIKSLCQKYNIKSSMYIIYPGYDKNNTLYEQGSGIHCFNLVEYNKKIYLVDVTYSQFFYEDCNNLDRIGVMGMSGCKPGIFMLMDGLRNNVAINLLQNGYIELTDERLKAYLDGFTISFRNGLYYEERNEFSYVSEYTTDDYIDFLTGFDSQINHEGKNCLGYQRKPLKNK